MKQNAHAAHDLKQMQMLPLEAKIAMSKQRIRQWYEHWDGMVYVSFSGGKDSTVLKHIVDGMYEDVPAVFVNTGLEYPEVQKFAMSRKNVVVVRPKMRFDEVLKAYGYPIVSKSVSHAIGIAKRNPDGNVAKNIVFNTSSKSLFSCHKWSFLVDAPFLVSDQCCNVMKKEPAKRYAKETGRMPILGTMATESKLRYSAWLKDGCNAFDGKNPSSKPLSFWTEQDILEYIVKYNVPYSSAYGQIVEDGQMDGQLFMDGCHNKLKTTGAQRTGCMFCGFGCHLEKEPNRFQRMKETHPKIHDYCMRPLEEGGLGMREVLNYIGVEVE